MKRDSDMVSVTLIQGLFKYIHDDVITTSQRKRAAG